MSRAALLLKQLRDGLDHDQAGYQRLHGLLEAQFQAALRHQADAMAELADGILAQVAELDAQRERRQQLLVALLGRNGTPSLKALLARLPQASAQPLAQLWRHLQLALADCKALNLRNCQFIIEQQALMQQLLGREEATYAQR